MGTRPRGADVDAGSESKGRGVRGARGGRETDRSSESDGGGLLWKGGGPASAP